MSDIILLSLPFKYKNLEIVAPSCPHLGILLIASYIEKHGFNVSVLDSQAMGIDYPDIKKLIQAQKPKIVGITGVSSEYLIMKSVCKLIREIASNIKIVIGGPHASISPETINKEMADYIVLGEGEETFNILCEHILYNKHKVEDIDGIAFFKNGNLIKNKPRKHIENLDSFPSPAWHLVPMEKYSNYGMWDEGLPFISYISSRGCPFRCIYCTSSNVFGHNYRFLSPEKVIEDLELLYKKYNKRYIYFQDDEFTINKQRAIKICELIVKKKLPLRLACLARVSDIDEEILSKMKEANWAVIAFGAECGYEEGLEKIQKRIHLEQIEIAVNLCNKYGISCSCSFMIGFPWENVKEIKKTIKFAKKIKPDMYYFQILTPYQGTPLYDELKKENLLSAVRWEDYVQHSITGTFPLLRTRYLSAKELKYWNNRAHFEVFLNPLYIIRKFLRIKSFTQLKRNIVGALFLLKSIFKKNDFKDKDLK